VPSACRSAGFVDERGEVFGTHPTTVETGKLVNAEGVARSNTVPWPYQSRGWRRGARGHGFDYLGCETPGFFQSHSPTNGMEGSDRIALDAIATGVVKRGHSGCQAAVTFNGGGRSLRQALGGDRSRWPFARAARFKSNVATRDYLEA
jgi:hypothetical protein